MTATASGSGPTAGRRSSPTAAPGGSGGSSSSAVGPAHMKRSPPTSSAGQKPLTARGGAITTEASSIRAWVSGWSAAEGGPKWTSPDTSGAR